jgi:K+-transporting ATPase ATPase A chain
MAVPDPLPERKPDEPDLPAHSSTSRLRPHLRPLLLTFPVLTLLTGVLYPLVLAAVAFPLFPREAAGSLVEHGGATVGSSLIGQDFTGPRYFHPRPSAAGGGYDAAASGGTNLGPNSSKLRDGARDDPATPDTDESFAGVRQLADAYRRANGLAADAVVPVDAVTRSGSGLDPHISPANAGLQIARVARERRLDEDVVRRHVSAHTRGPQLGFLGDPRVDVLALNLALDRGGDPTPVTTTSPLSPPLRRWLEYAAFLLVVLLLARPVGGYLARVFDRRATFLDRIMRPVERLLHRLTGVCPEAEMSAGGYAVAFVAFSQVGTVFLFALLLLQRAIPGGPEDRFLTTPMTPDLAGNTAVSFATTTTWQAYGGETTLRYLVQVTGLASQGFLAGAAGLAVGVAFIRGFARERSATIGNFWADLIRATLWVLLPAALVLGVVLVWQGVPLNLSPYAAVTTLEGERQVIAQGPAAALEPIKNLGTNGGGFFAANGAHPYANPTPLTNFLGLLAIVMIPAALPVAFGQMTSRPRAGWLLLGVMLVLFVAGLVVCDAAEAAQPAYSIGAGVAGGNMEGKEVRFGVGSSVLAAVVTSNGATGSNNSMHGSYHPLGGLVLLVNMLLGEVTFGGLGSGLYSMVMVALIGVFLGGLMVGRTPEYLGKAIRVPEAKLVALYALLTPLIVLPLAGLAVATDAGRGGLTTNDGPRAFTEVVFAYASCQANNGQAMAGLNTNAPFYNLTTAVAMLAGRFGLGVLALLLAGRLAAQGRREANVGSLSGDTPTFGVLVLGTLVLVGAVCFLPALALGPLAEHLRPVAG